MYRDETLEEISDGRLYGENDMVKADTAGCVGCRQVCCHGMGSTIVLDPFDVHRLTTGLGKTFEQLMQGYIEINVVDGLTLPNMAMNAGSGSCTFLDDNNRCMIHNLRPGVCRLFPLGRYWEDEAHFKYILQKGQCNKDNLSKIKVKKWIGSEYGSQYDNFVIQWHQYLVRVKAAIAQIYRDVDLRRNSDEPDIELNKSDMHNAKNGDDSRSCTSENMKVAPESAESAELAAQQVRTICMYTLKTFYMTPYGTDEDFFENIGQRIKSALEAMGMS